MQRMNYPKLLSKRWQRLSQFFGLFSLCFLLVVSCASQTTTQNSTLGGASNPRVNIGTTLKVRTLDPADSYEIASGNLLYNLGDRLYTYRSGTTELTPQLATALPTISDDKLTYTIPLRQGVLFHDGTSFNAEAMAFSLNRFMENEGTPAFLLKDIVESVNATGEYELTIKLQQPFAAFPELLTFPGTAAISPQAYQIGTGQFKPDTFVGTGPYKLAQFGTDVIRLDVFEDYWGEKPQNQGVDIQLFTSSSNLFNAFRTRAIDVASGTLDSEQIKSLEKETQRQGWQEITADGNSVNYMVLNVNSEPLNRVEVRQALAAIVDRNILNQRVLQDLAEPLYSLIPDTFPSHKPVFEQYGDGNAEKAKQLLTQAGFSQANPAVVEIWYSSNSTKRSLVASTLKAIADQKMDGILQLELKSVESTTAFQNLDKGIYPTFLLDWYADYFDPDNYIQPFLDCNEGSATEGCKVGASQNHGSFYYNTEVVNLIRQQRQETDRDRRYAILGQIQDILARDVPFIPMWLDRDYAFAQKGINGVRLEPTQKLLFSSISK
uniref:Peptide ABC transporter substrate-binding protein n=2 Tax=Desertifilaceae TaxID=1969992 RepID=A0A1E5QFR1_9CYAN|nr:peptide ABC transporter substrate-binding protein [Desertifilum tharense IPPAS B-1220]